MPIFSANPKENTTPPLHSRLDNKKKTRKNYDSIFENNATFLLSGIDLNLTKVASNFLAFSDLFWGWKIMHNGLKLVLWQYSYLYAPTFSREILCKFDQSGAKLSGMFRPVLRM